MGVTLTINGKSLNAERGQTILQVARNNAIYIPTLCDYPGLPPHGSCRMCIVEVKGRPNTPTACTTPVDEGMVVETDTPQVRELRGELIRMLLADHPGACLFCPENQHCEDCMITLHKAAVTTGCRACPSDQQCELQEVVQLSGLQSVAYPVRYRNLRVEKEDPFFDRDYNLCVLCGRCIRVCESLHFTNIPTYVTRGSETRVGTGFNQTHLDAGCSFCGACVDACPTGALAEKTRKWDGKPDSEVNSTCAFCSLGCEVSLLTRTTGRGMIIGSLPGDTTQPLCVKGRFGVTELTNHPARLKGVQHIEQGQSMRDHWEDAVRMAAEHLKKCSPSDISLVISASCSNEDLYVADKFAREVMGTAATLSASARYGPGLAAVSRMMQISAPLDVLDTADLIFCLGLDAKYAQSVIETRLKQAVERGVKVITLNSTEHMPGRFASLWLRPLPGAEEAMLNELIDGPTKGPVSQAADLLKSVGKAVLLVGPDFLVRFPEAVERLQAAIASTLVAIPAEGNLSGALRLGLGAVANTSAPKLLYLVGTPVPQGLDPETFVLYQNTHTPVAELHNGYLLPMAAFGETEGSILDQAGRIKPLSQAVAPPEDSLPGWEILCRIARAMNKSGFDYASAAEITTEIAGTPANWTHTTSSPAWLDVPGEHDFMGADLSDWVSGLKILPLVRPQEGEGSYV